MESQKIDLKNREYKLCIQKKSISEKISNLKRKNRRIKEMIDEIFNLNICGVCFNKYNLTRSKDSKFSEIDFSEQTSLNNFLTSKIF